MNIFLIQKAIENNCPHCGQAKIYKSFFEMNERCEKCQYLFKRDSGFFVGSWIINYTLCTLIVMPIFLFLLFTDSSMGLAISLSLLLIIVLQVLLIPFARKLWIHAHYQMANAKH